MDSELNDLVSPSQSSPSMSTSATQIKGTSENAAMVNFHDISKFHCL